MPRARQLLAPARLAAWLAAGFASSGARLFEVGFEDQAAFEAGHIAGAGYLDTSLFEGGPLWNKLPDSELEAMLLAQGIRHDTTVVLYGRNNLAAARAAHLLLYAGVDDVRLLDGGLPAWSAAGLPLHAGAPRAWSAALDFGRRFPAQPQLLAGMAEVKQLLASGDGVLVSNRSWSEFIGEISGYPYIAARGDIPGARWGHAGVDGDVNSMADFQDGQGAMLPAAEIKRMWQAAGIEAGRRAVFYCGTGWRASLAFLYAWLMGWDDIAVFDGGWCEWSRAAGNPVLCRVAAPAIRAAH
ncbi:MAG: sulfurtransferase [Massilia sp.]